MRESTDLTWCVSMVTPTRGGNCTCTPRRAFLANDAPLVVAAAAFRLESSFVNSTTTAAPKRNARLAYAFNTMCVTFAPLIVVARTRFVLALASAHSSRTVFDVVVLLRDFFSHPISIVRASSTYCVSDVSISRAIRDRVSPPSSLGTMSTTALALGSPTPAISVPNRLDVHHHPRLPLDVFAARAPPRGPPSRRVAVVDVRALALARAPRVDRPSSSSPSSSARIAFAFGRVVASTTPISTSRHDAHGVGAIHRARARRPARATPASPTDDVGRASPAANRPIARGPCDGSGLDMRIVARRARRHTSARARRSRRSRAARAHRASSSRASVGEGARAGRGRRRAGRSTDPRRLDLRNDASSDAF